MALHWTKNSPSRVRFRPAPRRTFRFRVAPTGEASTYSRPVLGASGNLEGRVSPRKRARGTFLRKERQNTFQPFARRQLDLALPALELGDAHLDRVAEPVGRAAAAADEGGAERRELEVVAGQAARRQVALEDAVEADEDAGADRADDLALEGRVPALLEQPPLEQPGEAELVGAVLDLGRGALARGRPLAELGEVGRAARRRGRRARAGARGGRRGRGSAGSAR